MIKKERKQEMNLKWEKGINNQKIKKRKKNRRILQVMFAEHRIEALKMPFIQFQVIKSGNWENVTVLSFIFTYLNHYSTKNDTKKFGEY